MESLSFYVLLLIAIIAGWLLGRLGPSKSTRTKASSSDLFQDYFVGLNYLLNDEPDEAIDTFIKALEINSETIETHLALGALLRRRGKVDKAINVHQALLARPNLERDFSNSVRLQLALNYIAAGLLDRAERLLQEVLDDGAEAKWDALRQLITIYQTEKEWENAIACSSQLLKNARFRKDPALLGGAAHYCCELAEQYLHNNQVSQARAEIKRAFTFERKSIRAMLLLADIEQRGGNYKVAIKELLRVRSVKREFISQLLEPLASCHESLGSRSDFEKLLRTMVLEDSSTEAALMLAKMISARSGNAEAIGLLREHLEHSPSQGALIELLGLQLHGVDEHVASSLESLLNLVKAQAQGSSEHSCHHCGFETKSFFWMCPSCKQWDKIRPINELPNRQASVASK
ncbi:MAG: lipopolysaccharide assembly protein LapB [SAR86 cluster bacterium]|uniref:Lipopolysaccharide assembly protein B n=1 Tax=SAR86 cluster bacterium TaxID=2030880 RepID=A0A2A4XD14_9GAMM|nr:MAG: lipopolysaccharide assembly protein LapB [SAR86 cluster bacterium]